MAHVYKITSPTGKVYVGSTANVKVRLSHYRLLHCKAQIRLIASLRKYGWEAHIFDILEECGQEDMYRLEAEWGAKFDVLGPDGLNCSLPKNGEVRSSISEETRKRLSISHLGQNAHNKGIAMTEAQKELLRIALTGKPHSIERRRKYETRGIKTVIDLATGVFYDSVKQAALYYPYNYRYLVQMLCGQKRNRTSLKYA